MQFPDTTLRPERAGPPLWTILREAVVRSSRETTRMATLGVLAWIALLAVQAFDSARTSGVAGIAEFLSAVLGSTGGMLFVFSL